MKSRAIDGVRPPMPPPVGSTVRSMWGRTRGRVGVVTAWFAPWIGDPVGCAGSDDGPYGGAFYADFSDQWPGRTCLGPGEYEILEVPSDEPVQPVQ